MNETFKEKYEELFPKHFEDVWNQLKNYDFIHPSNLNRKMQTLYTDLIENKDKYIYLFSKLGCELIFNDYGFVHINAKLNLEQEFNAAMKASMQAYIIQMCRMQNTFIKNNEMAMGQSFSYFQLESAIMNNQTLLAYVRNLYEKKENDRTAIAKIITDLEKRQLIEPNTDKTIYTITPVFNYYQDFVKEARRLQSDKRITNNE